MKKKRNTRRKRKLWRARLARFIVAECQRAVVDFAEAIKAGQVNMAGTKVKRSDVFLVTPEAIEKVREEWKSSWPEIQALRQGQP